MRIDEYDFERTAQAVYIMNDCISDQYESWENFYDFMVSMAYAHCYKHHSFSTGGFNLTAYDAPDGERVVRASVSAFVALDYVKRTQEQLSYAL